MLEVESKKNSYDIAVNALTNNLIDKLYGPEVLGQKPAARLYYNRINDFSLLKDFLAKRYRQNFYAANDDYKEGLSIDCFKGYFQCSHEVDINPLIAIFE
jgi:hypothetical protein